jgi:hypothetical protein
MRPSVPFARHLASRLTLLALLVLPLVLAACGNGQAGY